MHGYPSLAVLAGGLAACAASFALAQGVATSNLSPDGQLASSGMVVRGPQAIHPDPNWAAALRMPVCTEGGGIMELIVPLEHTGGTNEFRFELREDDAGQPGSLVGEFVGVQGASTAELITIQGDGSIEVEKQLYWLVLHAVGDAQGMWYASPRIWGATRASSRNQGGTWTTELGNLGVRIIVDRPLEHPCPILCDSYHLVCWDPPTGPMPVDQFTCFIDQFAFAMTLPYEEQITSYANCDGSTTSPVLTVDDFTCFIDLFARGCP